MDFFKTKYELNIPNNCDKSWEEMSPDGKGRHCHHCAKTVIDFSVMSDHQIIEHLKTNRGNLCGRLSENQLNHPLIDHSKQWSFKYFKTILGLTVMSMSKPLFSQDTTNNQQAIHYNPIQNNLTDTIVPKPQYKLKGQVVDSNNIGLNNAIVYLLYSSINTLTDYNGNFEIDVPDSLIGKILILKVHYNNPNFQLYPFHSNDLNQKQILYFNIQESKYHLQKIGAVSCVRRRWWQFWKWF